MRKNRQGNEITSQNNFLTAQNGRVKRRGALVGSTILSANHCVKHGFYAVIWQNKRGKSCLPQHIVFVICTTMFSVLLHFVCRTESCIFAAGLFCVTGLSSYARSCKCFLTPLFPVFERYFADFMWLAARFRAKILSRCAQTAFLNGLWLIFKRQNAPARSYLPHGRIASFNAWMF